jgi:hypothetical protein
VLRLPLPVVERMRPSPVGRGVHQTSKLFPRLASQPLAPVVLLRAC